MALYISVQSVVHNDVDEAKHDNFNAMKQPAIHDPEWFEYSLQHCGIIYTVNIMYSGSVQPRTCIKLSWLQLHSLTWSLVQWRLSIVIPSANLIGTDLETAKQPYS